jgi:hypothetical protein
VQSRIMISKSSKYILKKCDKLELHGKLTLHDELKFAYEI